MRSLIKALAGFEYPGRIVLVGQDAGYQVAAYIVTGRNPASRAKGYEYDEAKGLVGVNVADEEVLATGDRDLLVYTAMRFVSGGVVVSNGSQGDLVQVGNGFSAEENLKNGLVEVSYEPDKYCTPRITGCIVTDGSEITASLASIRADQGGETVRSYFPIELNEGRGAFVCTYAGPNVRPTPSYEGDPIEVELDFGFPETMATAMWEAMRSKTEDLRVSVVVAYYGSDKVPKIHIINKAWR